MKKILLAVGSATTALQTARQIRPWLRERDTSLTLMAVVEPGALSPLSPVKSTLEQTEAVFTGAEEQPGIIVRVGDNPAAELCHEVRQNKYDLLALGLSSHHGANGSIGDTCRAVLRACPSSIFVTPPTLHTGMTPQILLVVDQLPPPTEAMRWLITQCRAQKLNVILCTDVPDKATALQETLSSKSIRTQLVPRSPLSASPVHALARDRRVRWIALPVRPGPDGIASPGWIEPLLSKASCPVLLVPSDATRHGASDPSS
jgi:nucleotide-binding universal stress UspA family protein